MQEFSNQIFVIWMIFYLIKYFVLNKFLKAQKATIDSIEKNILSTQFHVESGASNLRAALNYSVLSTAASGAFLGGIIFLAFIIFYYFNIRFN